MTNGIIPLACYSHRRDDNMLQIEPSAKVFAAQKEKSNRGLRRARFRARLKVHPLSHRPPQFAAEFSPLRGAGIYQPK